MPMFGKIKISKRVKNRLPMVSPGLCDNDILPSGGSSNSGITLDYSAINMGGIDNGVPFNHADDGYDAIEVNETDDPYNDDTKGRGSFVGSKEEGFDLRHNLDYGSTIASKKAFPDYQQYNGNPQMYEQIAERPDAFTTPHFNLWSVYYAADNEYLSSLSDLKSILPQLAKAAQKVYDEWTQDEDDDLNGGGICHLIADAMCNEMNRIGIECATVSYSIGEVHVASVVKLKDGVYTIDISPSLYETGGGYTWHKLPDVVFDSDYISITKESENPDDFPQYINDTNDKKAWLNLPQYSDPEMYEQTGENPHNTMEPEFNIFETYFADDKHNVPTFDKRDWFDWETNVGLHNMNNTMWYQILNDLMPLSASSLSEKEISEWISSLQVRMGIPPAQFPKIKKLVDEFRKKNYQNLTDYDEVENAPADLLLFLRLWSKTDPEWIKHNTIKYEPQEIETIEDNTDQIEAYDKTIFSKQAFLKTAVTYDSNSVIQELIKIPSIKALIDQEASGFVDKIIVTTIGTDIEQTQQQLSQPTGSGMAPITLEPISGNPYGHVWVNEDPTTHQKKPLDKIVRIDRVTDQWGTLVTILHEISHHRHPDWSESQVQSEAENLAGTVKQYLEPKSAGDKTDILFVKQSLRDISLVSCDLADTYQKQVIGLQNHSSLKPQHGLLFTYATQQPLTFWMGKVSFPIDIVFADQNNKIIKICRNCQPNSSEFYSCDKASKVIETVGSFCAFHDIDVGDHVFYANDKKEGFTQHILEKIKNIKIEQQKDLDMTDWNIKVVMKKVPDNRRFLRVSWTPQDYRVKKADILVNPSQQLIREALKEMSLEKLVRHSLLHILAGAKNELPEDKEQKLITNRLY